MGDANDENLNMKNKLALTILFIFIGSSNTTTSWAKDEAPLAHQENLITKKINIDLLSLSKNKKSFTWQISEPNAKEVSVVLNNVALPTGSQLEITEGGTGHTQIYNDKSLYDGSRPNIVSTSSNESVLLIKISKKTNNSDSGHVVINEYTYKNKTDSRAIIGTNQMKYAECYKKINPQIFLRSNAVAKSNVGSGWNIAGGPYVVTNHHVAGDVGFKIHDIFYNYQSPTCEKETTADNTLKIKTEEVVISGGTGGEDYAVYRVDELAYEEAGIRQIFGTLSLNSETSKNELSNGSPVYIAQHPWGAYKRISSLSDDGKPCKTQRGGDDRVLRYDCDTDGGASGSPVLDQTDHRVVALHYGGSSFNVGVLASHLYGKLKGLLPNSNKPSSASIGEGNVAVRDVNSFPYSNNRISLNQSGQIILSALDDARLFHQSGYSIFSAKERRSSGRVVEQSVKLSLITPCGKKSLVMDDCTTEGERYLDLEFLEGNSDEEFGSGWITLRVHSLDGKVLKNLVMPFRRDSYDPFASPFDKGTSVDTYTLTADKTLTTEPIRHHSNFGYVAVRPGQGPQYLTSSDSGYSALTVQVRNAKNETYLAKLRGYRKTACTPSLRPISSMTGCGSGAQPAALVLSFEKTDNKDLPVGAYTGLLPLMAKRDGFERNILVNLSLNLAGETKPPVAAAGKNFTVRTATTSSAYPLDGSASQNAESYTWTILKGAGTFWLQEKQAGPWVSKVENVKARALIPANATGEATYLLTVTGKDGSTAKSEITVTVKPATESGIGGGTTPSWSSTSVYATPCTPVVFAGKVWLNGWWTKGESPTNSGRWGVWREKGSSDMHSACK
ncbi:trypsin-like peptidase domain-containing protein [Pandoraea commovens]|nr:trypsin-like peptidase domain-containing protein [Pandoraea commovens]